MIRLLATLCLAAACVFPAAAALSQDKPPDGVVTLTQGTVAVGIGYTWGGGSLNFQGAKYPVKVRGLSLGQAGISKAEATGNVFNLTKLEDFNGNYTAAGVEATVAGGAGATALRNQHGVVIYLTSMTRGLNFKIAPEGVELTLAQ